MDKPFNVIKAECPELYDWLKEISRYSKIESFILPDYKNGIRVYFYTHNYRYSILVKPDTYLGCTVQARKPRAGEDWTRGNDLADGSYCYQTWRKIKNDIIAYELVKVIKPTQTKIKSK